MEEGWRAPKLSDTCGSNDSDSSAIAEVATVRHRKSRASFIVSISHIEATMASSFDEPPQASLFSCRPHAGNLL